MKHLSVLGLSLLLLACGSSDDVRGVESVSNDPTASGSAYRSYDGFAPAAASTTATTTTTAPTAPTAVDTASTTAPVVASPAAATPAATPTTAAPTTAPKSTTAKPAATQPAAADDKADIKKGEALIAKSDCFACHKVQEKVLGPSYKDVAAKYPNSAATIAKLADKIKKGGSGVWGAIPMSPHPTLSDDDAKAMVKYILSLK